MPKNGRLTREEMEDVIKSGGSVGIGGQTYTRVEDLPETEDMPDADLSAAEEELAAEEARLAVRRRNLVSRIAQNQAADTGLNAEPRTVPPPMDGSVSSDPSADSWQKNTVETGSVPEKEEEPVQTIRESFAGTVAPVSGEHPLDQAGLEDQTTRLEGGGAGDATPVPATETTPTRRPPGRPRKEPEE